MLRSIEGNKITGSQSSFDIVNFRAPLGNELENVFTASQLTNYREFKNIYWVVGVLILKKKKDQLKKVL